jgi:hypothetical protein
MKTMLRQGSCHFRTRLSFGAEREQQGVSLMQPSKWPKLQIEKTLFWPEGMLKIFAWHSLGSSCTYGK